MEDKRAQGAGIPRPHVSHTLDASHALVTSPVLHPIALAVLRLTLATYALFVGLYQLIEEAVKEHDAGTFFSYFTHLSYIGLIAYMYAAGVQTLCYALNRRKGYPLQQWPRVLQHLHILLYSTITTYPMVVTVIFWALLSDSDTFSTTLNAWFNISEHAMNTGYALFEILLTNAGPSPWWHLPACVAMLACYLGVAYITHATQGFYTYSFLDPGKEHAKLAGYIIAVGVAECVAFVLARGLTWIRMRLSRRMSYASSSDTEVEPAIDEDWQEIGRPGSSVGYAV
ncbi:hypothetical protein BD309DRAFT_955275 [Dichomitus squalens]|uniref:Uncharacterized protein n=1 Tax=Dichomitus squalens TaxID=114155 RepID=A0A4Q9P093_9APHY|nr:uncharacterized protein DICSQDRAFT_135583 [Dichomitus squalens LYAD-421 SS1]EJF62613.1 hypothetical protein DICSQDRAFT_135583 [Dichomitus squalens LYAD-421 SS1]TBU45881.1 hypothetical protein BD309DRAFT_955275 [Dichomitus squalens]TBU60652.1 hypothetical protein BD310DRAFT_922365 [Dichomitus squalens]